jgi:hypothetical protein
MPHQFPDLLGLLVSHLAENSKSALVALSF